MLTDKRMKLRSQIMRKRLLILLMLQMVIMLLMMMMTTMMLMVMTMMVMRCATSENICYNLQMKWLPVRPRIPLRKFVFSPLPPPQWLRTGVHEDIFAFDHFLHFSCFPLVQLG